MLNLPVNQLEAFNMDKKVNASIWLKAIAAVISFIAGILTGNHEVVQDVVNSFI